jgi:hypothetical protein
LTEKKPVYSDEFSVALKPTAHRLVGRVVFEATGKPAVGASVRTLHHAATESDVYGKFVVENLPAGKIELHLTARQTDAAPLEIRLTLPDEPKTVEHTFKLPPGLVVTGRIVDEETGAGVARIELNYRPRTEPGQIPSMFGFRTETETGGRFRLVVPPGRRSLEIWKLPQSYPDPLTYAAGTNAHRRFKRDINGKPGETFQGVTFRLDRGKAVVLMVLDEKGQPVAGAEVYHRVRTSPDEAPSRTDAAGRCRLTGVDREYGATVDVIHPTQPLGARVVIRPEDPDAGPAATTIDVKLQRTATLTGRVVDEEGKPLVDPNVLLYSDIQYPERLGTSVATAAEVRDDGSFSFKRMKVFVDYYVWIFAHGHAILSSEHIRAKSGEIYHPKEFRLPVADEALDGIVVDPRGQPVVGATVWFQHAGNRQLMAPLSGRWFHETDSLGRFHLTALPRGPLTLTAYRKPEGADRSIRDMVRVEAQAGGQGNEVQIVLSDPNERLRSIE